MTRANGVAHARQHICDRISHNQFSVFAFQLPARFGHAGDLSVKRQLAKADPADVELPQIASWTPTAFAAVVTPDFKLWSLVRLNHLRCLCHTL
jgi:hypothetical protein